MLTEELGKLRKRLADKGYAARTREEDQLLRELNALDNNKIINETLEKGEQSGEFRSYGGGVGVCRTCQRPL